MFGGWYVYHTARSSTHECSPCIANISFSCAAYRQNDLKTLQRLQLIIYCRKEKSEFNILVRKRWHQLQMGIELYKDCMHSKSRLRANITSINRFTNHFISSDSADQPFLLNAPFLSAKSYPLPLLLMQLCHWRRESQRSPSRENLFPYSVHQNRPIWTCTSRITCKNPSEKVDHSLGGGSAINWQCHCCQYYSFSAFILPHLLLPLPKLLPPPKAFVTAIN